MRKTNHVILQTMGCDLSWLEFLLLMKTNCYRYCPLWTHGGTTDKWVLITLIIPIRALINLYVQDIWYNQHMFDLSISCTCCILSVTIFSCLSFVPAITCQWQSSPVYHLYLQQLVSDNLLYTGVGCLVCHLLYTWFCRSWCRFRCVNYHFCSYWNK